MRVRLREFREGAGLTVAQLAAASNVPAIRISRIERGEVDPTASTLVALAKALGCTVDDLCGTGGK